MKMKFWRRFVFLLTVTLVVTTGTALSQDFLPELVKRIKPSAVAIETFDGKDNPISRGSGFFVALDRVITNRHVIDKAARVEVHLMSGKKFAVKGILAIDGEGDLALLNVDLPRIDAKPLPIVRTVPQEGESVVVVGNPFGLEGSVSNGIVSAVREISGYGKIIQITAPISPGSSGSPVVNMAGQVIGVATLQAAEGQSLNFAVPAERISQLKVGELQTFSSFSLEAQRNKRSAAERLYSQALAQLSRDDFGRAVGLFEKAAETDPTYAEAWYQTGYCYGALDKHADALKASRQAARLRPDWAAAHINVGTSSYALSMYKEAADSFRQAIRIDESSWEAQYSLGLTLGRLARTDEEILAYRRTIALKPDHANAIEKLGLALLKQKRYADAAAAFESLRIYRPDAKTYGYLGESLLEAGKVEESIEPLNTAVSYNQDFEKARYDLARAHLKLGNREIAQNHYEILRNAKSEWADRLYILLNP